MSSPPKPSAISLLKGGLGDDPLSFFKGCGLAARKRLAEDAPASWLGPLMVYGVILTAKFGEDEVREGESFIVLKEEICDSLCRMIGGLLLLAPVLATTIGFLLPGRWLLSPDRRLPDDREIADALGIDTATSSLKRVVLDLRADLSAMGAYGSVGVESSSNVTSPSMPVSAVDGDPWETGERIDELLDGRLEPELNFLRIGGGRAVVGRLFSFDLVVASGGTSEGLWGVGVTELSSTSSLPWIESALGEVETALLLETTERASLTERPRFLEDRGDGVGVVLIRPPWLMLVN